MKDSRRIDLRPFSCFAFSLMLHVIKNKVSSNFIELLKVSRKYFATDSKRLLKDSIKQKIHNKWKKKNKKIKKIKKHCKQ